MENKKIYVIDTRNYCEISQHDIIKETPKTYIVQNKLRYSWGDSVVKKADMVTGDYLYALTVAEAMEKSRQYLTRRQTRNNETIQNCIKNNEKIKERLTQLDSGILSMSVDLVKGV